jgi:hypothetical protein
MAFVAGSITGTVDLDRGPAIDTLRGIPKEAEKMKAGVENAAKEASASLKDSMHGAMKGISSDFGRRGFLTEALHMAAGGGAIMGISLLTHEVSELADKIGEIREKVSDGMGFREATGEIAREAPIVGGMVKMWDSIIGAATGEAAEIRKINAEAASTEKLFGSLLKESTDFKNILRDAYAELVRLHREADALHQNPLDQEKGKVDQSTDDKIAAIEAKRVADRKTISDDLKAAGEAAREKVREANRAIADAQAEVQAANGGLGQIHTAEAKAQAQRDLASAEASLKGAQSQLLAVQDKTRKDLAEADRLAGEQKKIVAEDIGDTKKDQLDQDTSDKDNKEAKAGLARLEEEERKAEDEKFEREASDERDLQILKAEAIQDNLTREKAMIDAKYAYEKTMAERTHTDLSHATAMHDQEASNATQRAGEADRRSLETPLDRFNHEMDKILSDLEAGAISKDDAKRMAAQDQEHLRKQMDPGEYKPAQNPARRFDFGDLAPPEMADPLKNLVGIQTDSLAEQKTQTQVFNDINSKIQTLETITAAPQP